MVSQAELHQLEGAPAWSFTGEDVVPPCGIDCAVEDDCSKHPLCNDLLLDPDSDCYRSEASCNCTLQQTLQPDGTLA